MATTFPTTLDTATTSSASDYLSTGPHSTLHNNLEDRTVALETKVGVDGSAVTTTHDYKLSGVTGTDKAASKTGTETLTNKTLTTPVIASLYQDAGKTKLMTLPDTASDTIVALAATQTLTNKTIDGDTNTVQDLPYSAIKGVAWTSFVPEIATLTNAGAGAVNSGYYCQIGKTVFVRIYIKLGATPTVGAMVLTLPVTISATNYSTYGVIGVGSAFDDNATKVFQLVINKKGTFYVVDTSGAHGFFGPTSSSVPFTWAVDDEINFNFFYETA